MKVFKLIIIILALLVVYSSGEIKYHYYNSTLQTRITGEYTPTYSDFANKDLVEVSIPDLIKNLVRERGYSEKDQQLFVRIAKAESNFIPSAKGYAGDFFGLFQIYAGTWDFYACSGDILDPVDNTLCAVKIQEREGFNPWHVYTANVY